MKNIDLYDELYDVMSHSTENRFGGLDMWTDFGEVENRAPNYRTIELGCDLSLVAFDASAIPRCEVVFKPAPSAKTVAAVIKQWELEGVK